MGEAGREASRVGFDGTLKLDFHSSKVGAKVVAHSRYVFFQMAEAAIPRGLFRAILERIRRLRPPSVVFR